MIDSTKLLIVLSDVAYIAELLKSKKPHEFTLHACKQINGTFFTKKGAEGEAIAKLFSKLDPNDSFHLVLPDSLFVDTIVSVKETSEAKIKAHLEKTVLTDLKLSEDSHYLKTTNLNEFKGVTRVQIVAIAKDALSVWRVGNKQHSQIKHFSPLSWVVKSIISLEPSISVLQLGEQLYTAQHFFGVDQTSSATISEPEKIVETIKTLKGAEPSIQTAYLLTNTLVEEQLKDALSKVLPLQQMTGKAEADQLPSYVVHFLQAAARTLSIKEYNVPVFSLPAPSDEENEKHAALFTATSQDTKEDALPKTAPIADAEKENKKDVDSSAEDSAETEEKTTEIDETSASKDAAQPKTEGSSDAEAITPAEESSDKEETSPESAIEEPETEEAKDDEASPKKSASSAAVEPEIPVASTITPVVAPQADKPTPSISENTEAGSSEQKTALDQTGSEDIDLSQFAQHSSQTSESPAPIQAPAQSAPVKQPIKHDSGVKNMLKMVLITTIAFIITIAVGVGLGLGFLKFAGSSDEVPTPTVEVEEQPVPEEPQEEASPSAETEESEPDAATVDLAELKVLVVNATTRAGYAGEIRSDLLSGDFEDVTAGNASGTYEDGGILVYLKESNSTVISAIESATDLDTTTLDDAQAEDAQGRYDVIIVLAE